MQDLIVQLVAKFQLEAHPEGGWYKETYRSEMCIVPPGFGGERALSTAIYFLLGRGDFSAFHRIKSDECWHFYAGQALEIFVISNDGVLTVTRIGNDPLANEEFQFVVPANCWFASRPAVGSAYCFVGCTVSPGFSFEDFELARADDLSLMIPEQEQLIRQLCRQ